MVLLGFLIFIVLLFISVALNISIIFPLVFGMFIFAFIALKLGNDLKSIVLMMLEGTKQAGVVLELFAFIGALTGIWRACGTLPYIVYYGISLIKPHVFLVFAFLLSAVVSYTIGSCFATVGTVGVILAVLSKAGGVNMAFTAGAAISGAYFGDRTSPVSSCANLIAAITSTEIYENVKNMLKSAAIPMAITILFFALLSYFNPISSVGKTADGIEFFHLTPLLLIPAAAVLLLTMFKVNIKMSMFISIAISCILAVAVQKMTVYNIVKTLVFGFQSENSGEFIKTIEGGGVVSMLKPAIIVFISSTYSGIFEKTDMLDGFEKKLKDICSRHSTFMVMFFVSLFSSCFTCNQTLTVMTSKQLLYPVYKSKKIENKKLALDLSNSAVTLCGLIPWNIACAVPLAAMEADISAIPFCVLLYMIPVCSLIKSRFYKSYERMSNI